MAEIVRFVSDALPNSITGNTSNLSAVDRAQPLSFINWVQFAQLQFTNTNDALNLYQSYLNDWYINHNNQIMQ